jgi:hypothetical protein
VRGSGDGDAAGLPGLLRPSALRFSSALALVSAAAFASASSSAFDAKPGSQNIGGSNELVDVQGVVQDFSEALKWFRKGHRYSPARILARAIGAKRNYRRTRADGV